MNKTCNADGRPCSFPRCMPCDEVRGGLVPVKEKKPKLPPLDGCHENYHIRRLDNRYRVYLYRPGWACQSTPQREYFYVGIERLVVDHWEYEKGSASTYTTRESADEAIIELYENWKPRV